MALEVGAAGSVLEQVAWWLAGSGCVQKKFRKRKKCFLIGNVLLKKQTVADAWREQKAL